MAGKRTPITGPNKDFAARWIEAEDELINSLQFARGVTQAALGKAIGVSGTQIHHARNGNSIPERKTLTEFCKLTGVSMDWLLAGQGSKFPSPDREYMDLARDFSKLLPKQQQIVRQIVQIFLETNACIVVTTIDR